MMVCEAAVAKSRAREDLRHLHAKEVGERIVDRLGNLAMLM